MRFFKKKSGLGRLIAAIVIGLVIASLFAPIALRWLVRSRLQAMIADQLDARLEMGGLKYSFPYTVDVTDASLVTDRANAEPLVLLQVPHLALKLAQSPLRSGPLVIESIQIDNPAIHLVQTEKGLIGRKASAVATNESQTTAASKAQKDWKLSNMLRLHRLTLHSGSAVYEDTTLAHTRPLLWQNLNIDLDTAPESVSSYGFHFLANNAPLATLNAEGSADVDSFELRLSKCGLTVNVDPNAKQSALPPEYQKLLSDFGVRGNLTINTVAKLPLLDIQANKYDTSAYDTTLQLTDAHAAPPQLETPLENVNARIEVTSGNGKPEVHLAYLNGKTGGVGMKVSSGTITVDPKSLTWKVDHLTGHIDGASLSSSRFRGVVDFELNGTAPIFARDLNQLDGSLHIIPQGVTTRPPEFSHDVDQFADMIFTVSKGILNVKQLRAGYGDDIWFIRQAEVDLTKLPKTAIVRSAAGAITFGQRRIDYPPAIEKLLTQANPSGPWFFELSNATVPLKDVSKLDYQLTVRTARGQLALNKGRIPVYNINTLIRLSPKLITIDNFDAGALRGEVQAFGTLTPGDVPSYDLQATVRNVEIRDLLRAVQPPTTTQPQPISGRAFVKAHLTGTIPSGKADPLAALTGSGNFEVRDGDFFRIPVMQAIENDVNIRNATTIGEAAGIFDIAKSNLHLNRVIVSSPILGVDGSGDIGFNQQLSLDLIAMPLGQWGQKLDVGDAASGVLDQIQKGIDKAAGQALYNIRVTGTLDKPETRPEAVPFLSKQAGNLIGFLKQKSSDGSLLNFAQQGPPAAQPTTQQGH